MRKIREVLRLRFAQGLSQRAIGRSLGISTGVVNAFLSRARSAGVDWALPEGLDDTRLVALATRPPGCRPALSDETEPNAEKACNVQRATQYAVRARGDGTRPAYRSAWAGYVA